MNPLALLSGPYGLLIKGVLLLALFGGISGYFYHKGYANEREKFDLFVAQTQVAGEKAKADKQIKESQDKQIKEKVDAENKVSIAALNVTIRGLRNAHPPSSFVPSALATTRRPDLSCYDRPLFVGTVGSFIEGVRGLVDQGSTATLNLNSAKEWAQTK